MTTWKRILSIAVIVGVVCAMAALFMGMGKAEEFQEAPDIQEAVAKAAVVSMEAGLLPHSTLEKGIDPVLSDVEKTEITTSYNAKLDTILASESPLHYSYAVSNTSALEASGMDSERKISDVTVDVGVSSCEITKLDLQDDHHAIVTAIVYTWNQRIYETGDGKYYITTPVNRDTETIELVKENGAWKVLNYLDITKEFMDNDSSSRAEMDSIIKKAPAATSYDTYEEALAAAKTYEMTSIVSTETE